MQSDGLYGSFFYLVLIPQIYLWQKKKMFTDSTVLPDVDSTNYEYCTQSELDPLLHRDEKGPTKKEERVAQAQFLALCWALFVVGWTDGSTGPLLPKIQTFYDVSWIGFFFFNRFFCKPHMSFAGGIRNSVLGIHFAMYGE